MCNIVHSTLEPINSKIYTDLQKLRKFLNTTQQRLLDLEEKSQQHLKDAFDKLPHNIILFNIHLVTYKYVRKADHQ